MITRIKNQMFLSLFFCFIIISCIFLTSCGQAPQGRFQLRGLSHGWGEGGLNPAVNVSGTWESPIDCVWYALNATDGGRSQRYTGHLRMTLTQNGNTVTGQLDFTTHTTTPIDGKPFVALTTPVAINGKISSTKFSWETLNETWTFTVTSNLMEGDAVNCDRGLGGAQGYDTDTRALKLTRD